MRVALVTSKNGKGLELDAQLLTSLWSSHECTTVQFDQPHEGKYDLVVFLEVVNEHLFGIAPRRIWVPNIEWCKPAYLVPARQFDLILAKTRDAERVLAEYFPGKVKFTGFVSRDRYDEGIVREPRFLHIGGDSGHRGTNAVLSAWREWRYYGGRLDAQLTIVSRSTTTIREDTSDVEFIRHADDEEIRQLQNRCLFHLQPSAYEGYGHTLREAQSCGAVMLTTGAGPMAELNAPFSVTPINERKYNLVTLHQVSGRNVRERVGEMAQQPSHEVARFQLKARLRWEKDQEDAQGRLREALETAVATKSTTVDLGRVRGLTLFKSNAKAVAIWGNLRPEHSTENEWRKAFEALRNKVVCFQEDTFQKQRIVSECVEQGVKLLLYVHTHTYESPGFGTCEGVVANLRDEGIVTVAPHLDLFFGLHGDQRDELVGKHASWKVDYAMTADGSEESARKFKERNVRHVWLPPGVDADGCYFGTPIPGVTAKIGFTGAVGYHREYTFREELIQALRERYGSDFQVFSRYRGEQLNDLYASVPIWIGDCCFAGRERYWSDRWPETCGRGGFLLAPQIAGNCIPLATYEPQNLLDLFDKVDYYLTHEAERKALRWAAHKHVKGHDTYTHRAITILKTIGLEEQ